ncbi:hypothetical protein ABGB12_16430 [Actinocorallia sp. B10E7]|uniref:hypothetical protein n=1 Tax=Actinocorallia sp. B10E7 TaxID=3153558 RepID=UPI00325E2E4C
MPEHRVAGDPQARRPEEILGIAFRAGRGSVSEKTEDAGLFEVRCIDRSEGVTDLYVLDRSDAWIFHRPDSGVDSPGGHPLDDRWSVGASWSGAGGLILPSGPK